MPNKVVIAGGTGFLGRPLASALADAGHDVVVLTRRPASRDSERSSVRRVEWTPNGEAGPWESEIDGAGAVVNLAGESIADGRWSAARKHRILESRILATGSLVAAIGRATAPPPVFLSGSAVGYYGPRGAEIVTEDTGPGSDFLAGVCVRWEAEASRAQSDRTRVVRLRTGLVLEKDGGALAAMLPPFRFGAGGPVGSGQQYWPWIHRDDWVGLVRWALRDSGASGPINATAPTPVTNAAFAKTLGRAMHRPALVPAPGFALRLLLGEMADALLLSGQRAIPERASRAQFGFMFTNLEAALQAIFQKKN